MAMNFWEAQKRAKSRTTLFVTLFIILTVIMSVFVELGMRHFVPDYTESSVPLLGILFAMITFSVAGFQYLNFKSNGGSYVAESLGARQIDPQTKNLKEKQLLNIVEEIAVAASLPMPPVYVMQARQINAFAAGITPQDAAITVTEGTLNLLKRDEIQGVIAHEFGHIYNGDMKISMRLAAMVMGFFFVLYIGLRIFQFSPFSRRSSDDDRRGANPVAIAALLFMVAGAFTWLFGSILKSAVSREREYLADACAVQFTRNPDGIANALRKIANEETSDMPSNGTAYSHLYLNDTSALSFLFQTHPPLDKRIAAIIGREYIPEEWHIPPSPSSLHTDKNSSD